MGIEETASSYYTGDQRQYLAERRELLGEEAIAAAQAEWSDLYARTEAEMRAGTDPADARVQALLDRMDELVAAFHGGHEGVRESLRRLWSEQGDRLRERYGPGPEVTEYLNRARAARRAG